MSLKAWECVGCGDLYANPEIELATVECRCGVGAGRWAVATFDVADVAKLRAQLRECERERDAARAEVADLIGRLRVANLNADDAARQRDAWREDARLRAINTDAARAEVARLTARVAEVETVSDELHAALAGLEWAGGRESCPQCGWTVKHMPKCELRRALDVAALLPCGGA